MGEAGARCARSLHSYDVMSPGFEKAYTVQTGVNVGVTRDQKGFLGDYQLTAGDISTGAQISPT